MKTRTSVLAALILALAAPPAWPTAQQIGVGDTALLFGGIDSEGGIGDWYVSNGVVQAIIDDVGVRPDLVGVLPPGTEPPIQSEIAFTGGSIIDLGTVGDNNDQLTQMFTVGGLSTSNFHIYDTISAPSSDTIRVSGFIQFPPNSTAATPCLEVVTDYSAAGTDPFITVTSTATNNCGVSLPGFGGYLDVFIWTQRSQVPFSGGGRGFNHPVLNLSNPAVALEFPVFMAAPGMVRPVDGIVDTTTSSVCDEVSYGLLPLEVEEDPDGVGGTPSTTTPVNALFGVTATLVSALGNSPTSGVPAGGTLTYVRHVYVGDRNDVSSTANAMLTAHAPRIPYSTGTVSGNVDASDDASVEASILITRLGRCSGNSAPCKTTAADCSGAGSCVDPVPTPGYAPNNAMSHVRTDATGAFSGVVLPQGDYELVFSAYERDDVTVRPVVVGGGNTPVVVPPLSARGTVVFTVRERSGGQPLIPARLVFKGVDATADPRFHKDFSARLGSEDILPETFGGTQAGTMGHAAGQNNIVYTATGSGDIQVKPGTYDIYASRGPEYSVQLKRVTVPAGGSVSADFRIKRSIKTRDAISADFHVHSGRSLDTHAALRDRVASFAAEGVEVMVATDHDKNTDYTPLITAFGLGSRLRSIIGDELTGSVPAPPNFPNSYGHINAWPVVVSPNAPRDGAIHDEYTAPNWIYKQLRDAGAEVIQSNHPRAGVSGITTIGFFNNIGCNRCANDIDVTCTTNMDCPAAPPPQTCTCVGYQPDRPITMPPNDVLLDDGILGPGTTANPDGYTNLDFDVMELANGNKAGDFVGWRVVRRDWFSLLNQGIFKPATGVSDSHRITIEHAGWARSYVLGVGDDPASFATTAFDDQVKAGAMTIGGGPYIEFSARASGGAKAIPGQLMPSSDGVVRLKVRVRSPAWIPVEEVRIIANGFQVAAFDATTSPRVRPVPNDFQRTGSTSRFNKTLTMNVTQDTYFLVEAGAKLPASPSTQPTPPPIVDIVVSDVVPLSFTNPIFVDRNANAAFDPPGLPVGPLLTASATPPAGFWRRAWEQLTSLAGRLTGEVVAGDAPGEMTGVTEEEKAEAVAEGEYFPLHELTIPRDAIEQARKAQQEGEPAPEPATAE
jgi:hypothetical protein